jgi:hypothetical protein
LYKDSVPVDEPVKKTTNEGGVVDPVGEIRPGQRTPVRPSYKPEVKRITPLPKPSGAVDDDESMTDEGAGVMHFKDQQAKAAGEKTFTLGDKTFPVKEAAKYRDPKYKDRLYTQEPPDHTYGPDMDDDYYNPKPNDYAGRKSPMDSGNGDPLTKGFGRGGAANSINTRGQRAGMPSRDQITSLKGSIKDASGTHAPAKFADRVGRAKKEVDEMLGNVAADAMKKAVGGGRGRNAEMDEASDWSQLHKPFKAGDFNDTPTRRRSSSGGEIDTSKPGVTRHTPVKGNYSGAGHDAGAETSSSSSDGPRGRGRPKGSKAATGAKINRGTSKLMTREGDQDPADQGEYGREGEMGRNEIHTMMRNAKQLEKMLGNNDDLPEWVQKKLSLASDYMQTIADYLASEKETDAEDQTGREVEVELAEKKARPTKKRSGNDGNLANNAKPYDKVTQGDVVAGRLGKDEMGGKSKPSKPKGKKEEEVEESTTSGSVATASTSGKASKGGMSFGKGIYDSIDRAVERQITESMNISMSMNNEGGGAGQTLTITATDEDASQLAQLLKMAGMGVSTADGDYTALMPHSGEEVCSGCGMADCGCGDMEQMDETYGDNTVDMNSPDYPTNTERARDNFGYAGGLNKQKASGMATIPVTDVNIDGDDRFARSAHYDEFRESIKRMREIAGLKPVSEDKAEWLKPEGMAGSEPTAPGGVTKKKEGSSYVYAPKVKDERLTTTIPSRYVNLDKKDQKYIDPDKRDSENKDSENSTNESIFTDTANLWKRYKG